MPRHRFLAAALALALTAPLALAQTATPLERGASPDVPQPQTPGAAPTTNLDLGRHLSESDTATGDWFGARTWLNDRGIIFAASLTADWGKNLKGGVNTEGWAFLHLFDANLTLDTEKLVGLKGGTFFLSFQNHVGDNPSAEDTGDFQEVSNIIADGRTQISELWYQQAFFDDLLKIKVGKIDANSDFALPEAGESFLNASFGQSPTIFLMPTYPDPATGMEIFVEPCDYFYAAFGLFDGALAEGVPTGSRGPKTFFGEPADLFLIGELGFRWKFAQGTLPGRFAAGGWGTTGDLPSWNGGVESGTAGVYALAEQLVWRENLKAEDDTQGLALFGQFGWADPDVSEAEYHVGGGLSWIGPIPSRDADVLGLGATWAHLTDEAGAGFGEQNEVAYEVFYKIQVTPFLAIQPDLQYIHNPGGDSGVSDAVAAILRVMVDF